MLLNRLLAHPLTRNLDLDDPSTTHIRREIVARKPFLKRIYDEWYTLIASNLPECSGRVLELGSGAGFLNEYVPGLMTSEVFPCPGIDLVLDGQKLPFPDNRLRGIVMTNVFHHIPNVRLFLAESLRCLKPGGRIVAIEPWVSDWSRIIYPSLHHEPFDPKAADWAFTGSGPLSSANGALPWMIFERDRAKFEAEFPGLFVRSSRGLMPFRYLICGGISMRNLMPSFTFPAWRALEGAVAMPKWAMFGLIVIEKR